MAYRRKVAGKSSHILSTMCITWGWGATDGMHVSISKLQFGAVDYYYFKSSKYTMNCQAIVDKRFFDLYLGMHGSTNDSRMLCHWSLYNLEMHEYLMDAQYDVGGFTLYVIGDSGFPLLPWLMDSS